MKRDLVITIAAVAIILGVCYAIAGVRTDQPLTPSRPYTPSAASGKKAVDKNDRVIMHVNGEPVTEREFAAFLASVPEQQREMLTADPQGKHIVAEEIAKLKSLEQEGRRLGAENDPESNLMLDFTRSNVYARYALKKLVGTADEKKLRAEYEKNVSNPAASEWSHIMIAYQGGQAPARGGVPSTLSAADAQKKAEALAARIRAGAKFEDVARIESDDERTAAEGGRLPGIDANALPAEVRTLKSGEVSAPVRTPFGIHLFRLGKVPFDAVRGQLENQAAQEEAVKAAERIAKAAKVDLDPAFFPKKNPS